MSGIIFDRSRNEAFCKCPRLRFLSYEYPVESDRGNGVNGISRKAMAVPLLTGSMVHKGIELFLTGFGEGGALDAALAAYDEDVAERGIEKDDLSPQAEWTIKVQRALIEALVSGWIGFVYPRIEQEYEILEVEKEERADFLTGDETLMTLLARTDVVCKRKSDGALFVRNFKTISEPDARRIEAFRYDTQTISEVLAVERRYGKEFSGVIYDLLIKGGRKQQYPEGSGTWHNNSPLIWCWRKEGQTAITDDQFALSYYYTCDAPHAFGKGKQCPGGENHSLGKGWKRQLVTEVFDGGVMDWFNWLQQHVPGTIDAQFQTLPAMLRTPFDVATWKRTVLNEEARIAEDAETCRESVLSEGFTESLPILDNLFPKHTQNGNCIFPSKCPMFGVCWGPDGMESDLLNNDFLVPRTPNHPESVIVE